MIKDFIASVAAKLPEAVWGNQFSEGCLLPYYHMVSDDWVPHVSPLYRFRSVSEFTADLECFLQKRTPLTVREFLKSVKRNGCPPKNSFLLTFDDGFREMHDVVAPILLKKGVPAVFFLNSASLDNKKFCYHQQIGLIVSRLREMREDFPAKEIVSLLEEQCGISDANVESALRAIDWQHRSVCDEIGNLCGLDFCDYLGKVKPYLSSAEVLELLDKGFEIGAHSIDHPRYRDISLDEQLHQTRESVQAIKSRFKVHQCAFAFPHTDSGVSQLFYKTMFEDGCVSAFFGTSAPHVDCIDRSFQRFSMEKTKIDAAAILARQQLRRSRLRVFGEIQISR